MQGIKYHLIDESPLNGRAFVTNSAGLKRTSAEADLEDSSEGESDGADSAKGAHVQLAMPIPDGPKPGKVKKTKGRVKIKMEFIDNKLRRYTTFSKRKTGIMKKAYELSTLTGTQVMLLVASETGHVYTFATRKLQPMITSDSGKALIQTCLNSPDPPPTTPSQQKAVDQRMNPTGFEETELSYAVNEEDGLIRPDSPDLVMPKNYPYQVQQQTPPSVHQTHSNTPSPLRQPPVTIEPQPQPAHQQPPSNNQQFTFMTPHSASQSPAPVSASVAKANPNISMQLTGGGGITILPSGLAAGTPLTLSALGNQQGLGGASGQQQTLYRIPNGQGGQAVVALPNMSQVTSQQVTSSAKSDQVGTITLSSSQPNVTVVPATGGSASTPPGTVMYQTPQGVVYAAPSSALPEGYIFNLPQTPALQVASPDSSASQQQQFITIPVSLAAGAQVLQPLLTSAVDAGRQKKLNK